VTVRRRASGLLLLASALAVAGCLGGRRGAPPALPPEAPAADSLRRDSLPGPPGTPDSLPPARADSAAADSVAARRDSLARDSVVRDSAARADSTRRAAARRRPATRECLLDFNDSPPESRLLTLLLPDGTRNAFIGGGVVAKCQGEANFVRADSAEQYESLGLLILIGSVVFEEPGKLRVLAPTATYFSREERLIASGGVTATDLPSGSVFSGPTIEYFRAGRSRPVSRLYAPMRPSLTLVERDSSGRERPPVNITANQMEDIGDTLLVAWGNVVVNRELVVAEGDTAAFNKLTEQARLMRGAFVLSRDTARPFRLIGDTIDLYSTDRQLDRVVASHRAQATSRDLTMRAERVAMRLDSQQVERAWAYGDGRAVAETPSQSLEADSIEVDMPQQQLRELHAVGRAIAQGTPDTLRIRTTERDLLLGDTIVAEFDTATTPPDTVPRSVMRLVTASGGASSRYQVPSQRGPHLPPAINYVRGVRIRAAFRDGEMESVLVDSQAVGLYLEPVLDSLADSLRSGPDTARRDSARGGDSTRRVPPDTASPPVDARSPTRLAWTVQRTDAPAAPVRPAAPVLWPRPATRPFAFRNPPR
jgi:hypothetical protein